MDKKSIPHEGTESRISWRWREPINSYSANRSRTALAR